jgi:sec-independent protein translocase protein TatB
MLDIGWPELFVIIVIALLVIGPRDLPKALYTVGQWVRKARMVAGQFQRHVDDMVRESHLDEVRDSVKHVNKIHTYKAKALKDIENTIDPNGDMKKALDPTAKSEYRKVAEAKSGAAADAAVASQEPAPAVENSAAGGPVGAVAAEHGGNGADHAAPRPAAAMPAEPDRSATASGHDAVENPPAKQHTA